MHRRKWSISRTGTKASLFEGKISEQKGIKVNIHFGTVDQKPLSLVRMHDELGGSSSNRSKRQLSRKIWLF